LPAASTAVVLSPVAMPEGSGLGSSAKQGAESAAKNPASKRVAAYCLMERVFVEHGLVNDRREEYLPARFVISRLLLFVTGKESR
jgi:hypothetical protein